MTALRRQLRPLSWIALVAVWALALLPALSHAHAYANSEGAGGWAEVCTTQGPLRVAVDASGKLVDTVIKTDAMGAAHLQHCPLCALTFDAMVLPSAAPATLPRAPAGDAPPAALPYAWRTGFAWRSPQPRGPPASS